MTFRQRVIVLLSSNKFESFVIFLLFLYILVVMTQIILDELFYNQPQINYYQALLSGAEAFLLSLFLLEILSNLYAYGINYYLRDKVMFLDTFAIFFSIAAISWLFFNDIVGLSVPQQVLVGAFRITRLFLIYQKIQQCKDLSNS